MKAILQLSDLVALEKLCEVHAKRAKRLIQERAVPQYNKWTGQKMLIKAKVVCQDLVVFGKNKAFPVPA